MQLQVACVMYRRVCGPFNSITFASYEHYKYTALHFSNKLNYCCKTCIQSMKVFTKKSRFDKPTCIEHKTILFSSHETKSQVSFTDPTSFVVVVVCMLTFH